MKPDFSELALARKKHFEEQRKKQEEEKEKLKKELANEYEVTENPKLDLCFKLAWNYGHAYGEQEVEDYFADFVELIK